MKNNFKDKLIKKDIKKKKRFVENIFSLKLNYNIIKIIMNYLNKKDLLEFAKTCIFIFNNFIDYENSLLYNKFENIHKKRTCKILLENGKEGFGFFVKILFSSFKVFIININLIKESILGKTNKLRIKINNNVKEMDLNNRIISTNKKLNISIIEILNESDGINDYFEYNDNISELIDCESICIFNNQNNINESIICGGVKRKEIINENFIYSCKNNNIYFGSPIIDLLNDKIIGIHVKFDKLNNVGNILKEPIDTFIKEKTFSITSHINNLGKRRILAELKNCRDKSNNYIIIPRNGDLSILDVTIFGPEDSPYKDGKFILEIKIPSNYPSNHRGPSIYFKTKIYHPDFRGNGQKMTCCNLKMLEWWEPGYTIPLVVDKIYCLLKNPQPYPEENCPNLNQECAILMKKNFKKYQKIATQWTKEFAA